MESLNTAIITAAGSGTRMLSAIKKQFIELAGIPILIRTLERFFASAWISNLIITAPEEDLEYTKALIEEYYGQEEKPWIVIPGGSQRQDSIFGALQLCPDDTSLVFIHDAVRPFISLELIAELGQQAVSQKAVIPVAKIKHTVKSIQGDHIENTIPRERLVHVFTPQVFDFELITNAYEKAYEDGFEGTDDASLVEHLGHPVGYLYGSDLNIKITDEDDLFLASQIIKHSMI
ncbi:MAG: 2-C-methyl-D-erythritol 4-phosphate cytidylyltransferase [Candidatus Cloacimonetes bacterium]|nr:2-C-methyl-D-erythritol 4-phosphate cytidylyltransferase [Candidatus Cloacimonadota bacterium]NLO12151.1 2-C-methyl-D-erythritol 4-phosphate cytidylyltransferase [Candidatus Cloacimonadota bacterium]